MVLEALYGFRGVILGALGALWGVHWGSLGAPELLKSLGPFDPRAFLSLLMFFLFFLSSFFDVVFYLLSEPLGVDFELPNWPSHPQKCWFYYENLNIFEKSTFSIQRWFWKRFGALSASFWELLGGSWGALGSSLGPLDRPKRASRFVLELSWASFARFLLPKMALGGFWGRLWLVLGAPEGLLRVVLASVKPISTIKTALPSFDTLSN